MTRMILLARHGLAAYETDLMTDAGGSLTSQGRTQARSLGEAARLVGVSAVWCSPLSRAVQTAEIAAAGAGIAQVTVREDLREYPVGNLAGRPIADESRLLMPVFEAWQAGDDQAAIPGAESISAIVERVSRVLEEVAASAEESAALVVSHGGAIMATVPTLIGATRDQALGLVLDGGSHLVLMKNDAGWSLAR